MLFSKQQSVVGIDIGTSYIKVAQVSSGLQKSLDTYGIVNTFGQFDLQGNAAVIDRTAELLNNLLRQARVTSKRCIVSLPNSSVFTSVIDMPAMSETELASAIKFEAKKYVPLPFADVALSWSVISTDPATKTLKVLLIAVPNQVRDNYVKVFERAGLELQIIEIEALALIRSLVIEKAPNNVIIDIGAKSTGLNVTRAGLLQLTRNLNVGGDTITERIAQTLNISTLRAEQFKKDFGLSKSTFIPEAVKPVLNSIKAEVKQLLGIYQTHNLKVDKVLLVGGGANLPGILDFFNDLGIPIELGNPLAGVSFSKAHEPLLRRYGLQLSIAIGLALRNQP
jgi:type IV pilus assembly protein PilM